MIALQAAQNETVAHALSMNHRFVQTFPGREEALKID
mgnify:FL=1